MSSSDTGTEARGGDTPGPEPTFWNGLPTPARKVWGTVATWDPEIHPPLAWWRDIQGARIKAVEVVLDGVNAGGGISYLDDRDGHGWVKVTKGHGGPRWHHANVPLVDVQQRES